MTSGLTKITDEYPYFWSVDPHRGIVRLMSLEYRGPQGQQYGPQSRTIGLIYTIFGSDGVYRVSSRTGPKLPWVLLYTFTVPPITVKSAARLLVRKLDIPGYDVAPLSISSGVFLPEGTHVEFTPTFLEVGL